MKCVCLSGNEQCVCLSANVTISSHTYMATSTYFLTGPFQNCLLNGPSLDNLESSGGKISRMDLLYTKLCEAGIHGCNTAFLTMLLLLRGSKQGIYRPYL